MMGVASHLRFSSGKVGNYECAHVVLEMREDKVEYKSEIDRLEGWTPVVMRKDEQSWWHTMRWGVYVVQGVHRLVPRECLLKSISFITRARLKK